MRAMPAPMIQKPSSRALPIRGSASSTCASALVEALSHPVPTHLRMLRAGALWKAFGMRAVARIALALGGEPEAVYF
jgi:hypothetical protein